VITTVPHAGTTCQVATVDLRTTDLSLVALHHVGEVEALPGLVVATNGGLYHSPEVPVGWTVVDGVQTRPIERGEGVGNFFLTPNGAFWLDAAGPHVARTEAIAATGKVRAATQSGPLLVERGALHPAFLPASDSAKARNGVGRVDEHTVVLASCGPLNFHAFATLFRDVLHAPDALFLDGSISTLFGPSLPPTPAARAGAYATFLVVTRR
jgi:uncharacterized protein YigE (DUF2233 family)